jgi:hypothetical protein
MPNTVQNRDARYRKMLDMARPARFERATLRLEGKCHSRNSITWADPVCILDGAV